jgi:AAA domain
MSNPIPPFADLGVLATHFRTELSTTRKKFVLLFAYNGIGKTRLSMAFKDAGKNGDDKDTLYYNAFTEDLFSWDNDFENDTQRELSFNRDSRFFSGLQDLEMENRIRPLLQRYADFDFNIDYDEWKVNFKRQIRVDDATETIENIKVSRGEENIFIWCFFLAVAQLAIDEQEKYEWVKYIYIDDPISSLDDNNAIAVASHLAQMIRKPENKKKMVISSHHTLFFNVMWNEFNQKKDEFHPYFLSKDKLSGAYTLRDTHDTPYFHHVALLKELHNADRSGNVYTYHFNMMRSILEKTAAFHGFKHFSTCIKQDADDIDGIIHARIINILSHGNYSLFEPREMLEENKQYFRKILTDFMNNYRFNPTLFIEATIATT